MRSKTNAQAGAVLKKGGLVLLFAIGVAGVCFGNNSSSEKDHAVDAKKICVAPLRDPFWPVGFEPTKKVNVEVIKQQSLADKNWNEAMKQVSIQGVSSSSGEYYAIINAEARRVGESVSVEFGGMRYTWKIDRIAPPGSVKLRRVSVE